MQRQSRQPDLEMLGQGSQIKEQQSNCCCHTIQVCSECLEGNRAPPLRRKGGEEARKDLRSQEILDWRFVFSPSLARSG